MSRNDDRDPRFLAYRTRCPVRYNSLDPLTRCHRPWHLPRSGHLSNTTGKAGWCRWWRMGFQQTRRERRWASQFDGVDWSDRP